VVAAGALAAAAGGALVSCTDGSGGSAPCADGGAGGRSPAGVLGPNGSLTDGQVAAIILEAHHGVVHLAEVALIRSHADAMRSFATTLRDDHNAAMAKLQLVLQAASILPLDSALRQAVAAQAAQAVGNLWATASASFDAAFSQLQVGLHETLLQLLDDLTPGAQVAGLKAELQSELATEMSHLAAAQQLAATFSGALTAPLGVLGSSLPLDDGQIAAVIIEAHSEVAHVADVATSLSSAGAVRSFTTMIIGDSDAAMTNLTSVLQSEGLAAADSAKREAIADQGAEAVDNLWATASATVDSAFAELQVTMNQTLLQLLDDLTPGTLDAALATELQAELATVMNDLAAAQQLAVAFPAAPTSGGVPRVGGGPTIPPDGGAGAGGDAGTH
jgi:hypothetical protein